MAKDTMKITVLADGTIKVETSAITTSNHTNAEAFVRLIAQLAGGETEIERKQKHQHTTVQDIEHEAAHEHLDQA
jgi:hypothetical protein